jgi:hypothetical protein
LTPHPVVVFWTYSHPTLLQRMNALGPGDGSSVTFCIEKGRR